MKTLSYVNFIISILFMACYAYQAVYLAAALLKKQKVFKAKKLHRYGVLIAARNEEAVIAQLIRSVRAQKYPEELIDIFVVADNCTDNTAQAAREAGAVVYERHNTYAVGKGYALRFLLENIFKNFGEYAYDGFFVFDADNVLSKTYVTEMNKVFDMGGFAAITSFRNSKNFDSSWVSRGYGTWFIREATYLNNARMILGTSCAISGTGYLISADMIERMHGWDFHLLTEDIQFSVFCAVNGYRIGYAHNAVFYDEQPVTFSASWKQRMRWTKGFYQVFAKYVSALLNTWFKGPKNRVAPDVKEDRSWRFAAYDMTMTIAPAMILTIVSAAVNGIYLLLGLIAPEIVGPTEVRMCLGSFCATFVTFYLTFFLLALLTTATEGKKMHMTPLHRFTNLFTFPVFMLSYVPLALVAAVKKVDWVPTRHTISKTLSEIQAQ